jgi:hypothetical protein
MPAETPLTAFDDIEDCTVACNIPTKVTRRQLHRQILMKRGGWALVVFQAQDYKAQEGRWADPYIILERYVKRRGKWRRHTHVNLRHGQAVDALQAAATWEAQAAAYKELGIDIGEAIAAAERGAKKKARRRRDDAGLAAE